MRMRLPVGLVLVLLLSIAIVYLPVSAGDPSPTPAPSKTPEPSRESDETEQDTDSADDGEGESTFEAFTQDDLSVLTGNVQRPNALVWHEDLLYAACNGDWTLYELEAESGDTITYSYGVRNAHMMYVEDTSDTLREIWIPDYDVNALVRVSGQGSPVAIAEDIEGPWGIAFFDEDHFLVTTILSNSLLLVDRQGSVTVLNDSLRSPTGVAVTDDFVFVANNGSSRQSIVWVERESLVQDQGDRVSFEPLVSGLQNTTGLTMGEDGLLYFAYAIGTRGVVGRVDPVACAEQGGCSNDEVEIVLYTELAAPLAGLTISPDMQLFVHTIYRPEIYWVQLPVDEMVEASEMN